MRAGTAIKKAFRQSRERMRPELIVDVPHTPGFHMRALKRSNVGTGRMGYGVGGYVFPEPL